MADFFSYIESIIPVSAELKQALDQCIIIKELSKGEIVLRAKEKCQFIYFIETSLLRGYYFNEDKEVTH
jgi:CRP-like cAMP-binding protein